MSINPNGHISADLAICSWSFCAASHWKDLRKQVLRKPLTYVRKLIATWARWLGWLAQQEKFNPTTLNSCRAYPAYPYLHHLKQTSYPAWRSPWKQKSPSRRVPKDRNNLRSTQHQWHQWHQWQVPKGASFRHNMSQYASQATNELRKKLRHFPSLDVESSKGPCTSASPCKYISLFNIEKILLMKSNESYFDYHLLRVADVAMCDTGHVTVCFLAAQTHCSGLWGQHKMVPRNPMTLAAMDQNKRNAKADTSEITVSRVPLVHVLVISSCIVVFWLDWHQESRLRRCWFSDNRKWKCLARAHLASLLGDPASRCVLMISIWCAPQSTIGTFLKITRTSSISIA